MMNDIIISKKVVGGKKYKSMDQFKNDLILIQSTLHYNNADLIQWVQNYPIVRDMLKSHCVPSDLEDECKEYAIERIKLSDKKITRSMEQSFTQNLRKIQNPPINLEIRMRYYYSPETCIFVYGNGEVGRKFVTHYIESFISEYYARKEAEFRKQRKEMMQSNT